MGSESMQAIWDQVKGSLDSVISVHGFKMWIEPIQPLRWTEGQMVLGCPNALSRKWVLSHYKTLLEHRLSEAAGANVSVILEVTGVPEGTQDYGTDPFQPQQMPLPNLDTRRQQGRLLRKDFTFDQFVVGDSNGFAYSAALAIACSQNRHQNTLLLLSSTGLGKSHLSQAVGHHILNRNPTDRVYYTTAEEFTNEMIRALRSDAIDQFKEKYRRKCDVLLLDDVHFLGGKDKTQTELSCTLDCLLEANKKLIFTSCFPPAEIPKLQENVRSRISGGLVTGIDPPDFRTRVRILQKKASVTGQDVPRDVIEHLASELTGNVRLLESGLSGVVAKSSLLGIPMDVKLAGDVVRSIVKQRRQITLDVIKDVVCKYYRVTTEEIVSKSRKQRIVRPRQIAIYLARRYTDQPLQAIGRSFNRYHATAMHSIGAVERSLRARGSVHKQVEFLCEKLESGEF